MSGEAFRCGICKLVISQCQCGDLKKEDSVGVKFNVTELWRKWWGPKREKK